MIGTTRGATAVAIAVLWLVAPPARPELQSCPCVADTYVELHEGIPWSVRDAGRACEGLYPGSNRNVITDGDRRRAPNGDRRHALFAFDLATSTNEVRRATLRLTCTTEGATGSLATVTVHPLYVHWSELDADWTMRTATEPWLGGSIDGDGNYDPLPAATRVNGTDENWTGKPIEFDVTPLVQQWITGGLTNHGVLVMSASDNSRSKRLDWCSRDGNPWRSNNWPQLIIETSPLAATNDSIRTDPGTPP